MLALPGAEQSARALATLLETVFEEVVIVALDGSPSDVPLGRIVEALEAATANRVLIVGSGFPEPPLALLRSMFGRVIP